MPSSSCLCKIHNEMFNVSDIISTKMCSSAKKVCEYRHLQCKVNRDDGANSQVGYKNRENKDVIMK